MSLVALGKGNEVIPRMGCCHVASVVLKLRKINTETDCIDSISVFSMYFRS